MAKCFWILIVALGFSGAFYLINSSYNDWNDSPISTTISTHPLDDFEFPIVTVCPPKGSTTALNHDLKSLSNVSLSEEDKTWLLGTVYETMIARPHRQYVGTFLKFIKQLDVKRIWDGHMSVPKPYGKNGFEIRMSDTQGSVNFGNKSVYDETFFEKEQEIYVVLEFPEGLAELVGDGSFVVELDVETNVEKGEVGYVEYGHGDKFSASTRKRDWSDAQSSCNISGGDLAYPRSRPHIFLHIKGQCILRPSNLTPKKYVFATKQHWSTFSVCCV